MTGVMISSLSTPADERIAAAKLNAEDQEESGDETTPTTTVSECSDGVGDDDDVESTQSDVLDSHGAADEDPAAERQLSAGLFPSHADASDEEYTPLPDGHTEAALASIAAAGSVADADCGGDAESCKSTAASEEDAKQSVAKAYTPQETLFVFDWDDTVLPSTWINKQGLRLDAGSVVSDWQKDTLGEVADTAADMLTKAKQHGTVVLLTNAERGWIELSCQKFLPTLLPTIENVKIVSARTSYETAFRPSPLDWKVLAFEAEIARACGAETLVNPSKRKNIHSLGDSIYEREALLRATVDLPNCSTKSLKFVERPDIGQILKQHSLVTRCFDQIVQHDGNLDLSINCD